MLNQQIGPYKIISKLGEGGMALVYLAEKGTLRKQVALKVLNEDFISNRNIRGRFLSEAKKMINLNHPNIVGVQDLIDEPDFVAIELEYIEGVTLKQYLNEKGALPDDEIEVLFKQMLDALGYVHDKGYVHRDIKPSNFMLMQNGTIKLTDFGIAKNSGDSNIDYTGTGTGMQMGTPKYMSPEQVRSTKDVDHRSDIYSLGVVLWEMVTGKVPYDIVTESTFDVFRKIVDEPLEKTNTKWDGFIEKCTNKNIEYRYSKINDLMLQLNEKSTPFTHNLNELNKRKNERESNFIENIKVFALAFLIVVCSTILPIVFMTDSSSDNKTVDPINWSEGKNTQGISKETLQEKRKLQIEKIRATDPSRANELANKFGLVDTNDKLAEQDRLKSEVDNESAPRSTITTSSTFPKSESSIDFKIGDLKFGGIVFYIDEEKQYALICSQYDQGSFSWTEITGFIKEIKFNNFDDWKLPNRLQARLLINGSLLFEKGGLKTSSYWTSEISRRTNNPYQFNLSLIFDDTNQRTESGNVRLIRKQQLNN